ncbi:hypothetical protein EXIGLDRAFT_846048 [Exidia glandulosa HHB12029]|uniref:ABC transporter domain-containing protein n=1 Tax=Exidia glandulosa HHB12029 TaxID=1314781 RepID=A0A165B6C6_EXIGL|nr:hypothetical protein EXIGLDRAFT_846048 [Exidia glandulosa HHB12029]
MCTCRTSLPVTLTSRDRKGHSQHAHGRLLRHRRRASVLDYLSDLVCCLYDKPSVYGVVAMPFSVREGINIFLGGFVPTGNLFFREDSFKLKDTRRYTYPSMIKALGGFKRIVEAREFPHLELIVALGENGTGNTTFVRLLAGDTLDVEAGKQSWAVWLKPPTISPKFPGTFNTDVTTPMAVEATIDQDPNARHTSSTSRPPSSPPNNVSSRGKVIKRFILHVKNTAFVIEHSFTMATSLADSVIMLEGPRAVTATVTPPQTLLSGITKFLSNEEITFRRDPTHYRPRVNKLNNVKDREPNVGRRAITSSLKIKSWFACVLAARRLLDEGGVDTQQRRRRKPSECRVVGVLHAVLAHVHVMSPRTRSTTREYKRRRLSSESLCCNHNKRSRWSQCRAKM